MRPFLRKSLVVVLLSFGLLASPVHAQTPGATGAAKPPVMQSIFWNTLWGSGWGATMGLSYQLVSGVNFRESVVTGATVGGLLGYGLGIYAIVNGVTFDQRFLLKLPTPQFGPPQASNAPLPDALYTRHQKPDSSRWSTTLFNFRF